jgi:hypothetical protein
MVFRKSLTTLAAVALMAFAVTIAQAGSCGSPCPSSAQAASADRTLMADASCGHGPMTAQACAAMCKAQGMAGGGGQGQMRMIDCCGGKMPADCCKNMKMGGGACAMHGDMCRMDCSKMSKAECMRMMERGMCDMGAKGGEGCDWSCNGIWGDYDCSNPGGKSLLDHHRSHRGRHMKFMRGHAGEHDCMMMGKMGHGERGMTSMHMEGGCCAGGPKMERKVIMIHKGGPGMPGCMGMEHGAAGSPTPPPHATAPEGAAPPSEN